MKKFISLLLVFSILLLSGNLFAKERQGADLIIQKTDGTQVRGELIAVKENSLLLLDRESGGDVSIDIDDIIVITHVRKSKFWKGAGLGFLIGGAIGVPIAIVGTTKSKGDELRAMIVGFLAAFFGGVGLLIGGLIGAGKGKDKTFHVKYLSDSEIQEILTKLSKKARVRNSQ